MVRFRDKCTRLRAAPSTGPDGAPVPGDWQKTPEDQLLKLDLYCEFQPQSELEDVVGQQRTESTRSVWFYSDADVLSTDGLRYQGDDYQVDGKPKPWNPRGRPHHIEARCFLVQGG